MNSHHTFYLETRQRTDGPSCIDDDCPYRRLDATAFNDGAHYMGEHAYFEENACLDADCPYRYYGSTPLHLVSKHEGFAKAKDVCTDPTCPSRPSAWSSDIYWSHYVSQHDRR